MRRAKCPRLCLCVHISAKRSLLRSKRDLLSYECTRAFHEILEAPNLGEIGDFDCLFKVVFMCFQRLNQLLTLVLLVRDDLERVAVQCHVIIHRCHIIIHRVTSSYTVSHHDLEQVAVHFDGVIMLLQEHVATFDVQLRLAFVLTSHDGIQDVAPARQRQLNRLDFLIQILGQKLLPRFEFLQGGLDLSLDAGVLLLDGKHLALNGGQGVD